ncbi:MAG: cyclomaltodextrinase N-terminal domain-containing protein, partial [Flavobacteriales bacterium]|nr:cyclomaltodextrinase N-terminal domain-containing protein [Flavobacteriales bacterium]
MRLLNTVILFTLITFVSCSSPSLLVAQNNLTVEPPNWWVGMTNNQVQLMIHGVNLDQYEVKIEDSGVKITDLSYGQNSNYLWLTLEIQEDLKPGVVSLNFHKLGKNRPKFSYEYEFKSRESSDRGIDQGDFMYLIMPDRFSNGDVSNDQVDGFHDQSLNRDSMFHRHGGDLQGILNHLEYLEELGVTALWLNPVIENNEHEESYHGYAATDLYKVDARLGSNTLYKELCKELHQKGIKVVQDVVYNHWGDQHWMLADLPDSSFIHHWDKFQRTSYRAPTLLDPHASEVDRKIMTDGWFDHHMPDLNQKNPFLAQYLIQNSIWWIEEFGLDAFRIDTYAYPDQKFMSDLCGRIYEEYPDFSIFGETWVHGTAIQQWFTEGNYNGKEFSSNMPAVTDFQLYYAINDALTKNTGWAEGLNRLYYTLAKDYVYNHPEEQVIFLDNHDLSRFYSMIGEDDNKMKQGLGLLMTLRGIPCLYYGTEIKMKNFADPDGKVRGDF